MPERGEELVQVRLEKVANLRKQGIDPYPARCPRTHTNQEALDLFMHAEAQHGPGARTQEVSVAGRVRALRSMGKATFLDLRDGSARLQVHLRKDVLAEGYSLLEAVDLGDHLVATGPLFRTRTGEVTLEASTFAILSKATRPPPEKWHGLKDVETRYRERHLDLMANDEVLSRFLLRSRLVGNIRGFLNRRGFVEVETPILVPVAAGAMARPFVTHHHALDMDFYLRIATELHLKRCVIGGLDKVYEIGRVFRNEGIDFKHNPEYTLLESYEAYADYQQVMKMVEEMIYAVALEVLGAPRIRWGDQEIDLTPPWPRLSLKEEIYKRSGIDIDKEREPEALAARMAQMGIEAVGRASWGRLVDKLVSDKVEPALIEPVFLVDYPKEMSPLAKQRSDNPELVERFEAFAGGMEIANSYSELNDPQEQRLRFQQQEEMRQLHGDEDFDRLDEEFLQALEYGMPPTGGLGMGIDRLVMLLTGQQSIREVVLFPQLRAR
ncbi:MAG: lysine--tRNA ligase [Chloroflexi bacterium]|nr:lysine--tRNA ligase [Chloroflexota bacterium]